MSASRLLHDIKVQEAQVEKVGVKYIESPTSDFLQARLAAEEEKLRTLRSNPAKLAVPTDPEARRALTWPRPRRCSSTPRSWL